MPTKIVLKKTSPPSKVTAPRSGDRLKNGARGNSALGNRPATPKRSPGGSGAAPRSVFRSTILREMTESIHPSVDIDRIDDGGEETADSTRLSKDDIRASPRLSGYMSTMLAATVMLISVVQFYKTEEASLGDPVPELDYDVEKFFLTSSGELIYQWKVSGAIYVSALGLFFSFLTVLVHFDTVVAPNIWKRVFRDGSLAERHWILFLVLWWGAAVHLCTSTLSIGELQANVYFTSWISFWNMVLNFEVWRESAGLPTISRNDRNVAMESFTSEGAPSSFRRETTYNWILTLLFSFILSGAVTDLYYNRDVLTFRYHGDEIEFDNNDWYIVLSVVWSETIVCLFAIWVNEWIPSSGTLSCSFRRSSGIYRFICGWQQLEGLILITATGCKFWVILKYTGVGGIINGLSNAYFGVWGSFFNGVLALGTWLRENKNYEFIARNGERSGDVETQNVQKI